MNKIAILADSGCQIEIDKYKEQGVFIVPLCITFDNKTYLDQKDIKSEEVFHIMQDRDVMVMTSQPSVGELSKTVKEIKEKGYTEIIGISIATGLSSTLNGMNLAAELENMPITLVDSKGTAGIHKYLVETAMKLVEEGKSSNEIKDILDRMVIDSRTIIMAPNLKHLKKGGRITPAVALLGSMLKIVPVMELNHEIGGKIDTLAKVRTLKKAHAKLAERMVELGVNAKDYDITIEHVLCEEYALEVKNKLFELVGECEVTLRELPSVVGAHMGVGGVGCQFIKKYK